MVAVSFSVPKLKEMILNGTKKQTIRLANKKWCRVYDTMLEKSIKLQLYWKQRTKECEKLMEVNLISMYPKMLKSITLKEAIKDGFDSLEELTSFGEIGIQFYTGVDNNIS